MLVVTANWAFADGTLVASRSPRHTARAWLRRVRLATIRAGFGPDGLYRPPAGLDIVFAGDTFDCLATAEWRGHERPWQPGNRVRDVRRTVLVRCLRRASRLLAGLAALVRRGLSTPAPDRWGRPSSTMTTRVPVRVTLLGGDRDRQIVDMAAELNARGAVVSQAWCDGAVLVRHGHEFDPACHFEQATGGDRPPTLDESVAVDLVARFALGMRVAGVHHETVTPLVEALAAATAMELPAIVAAWTAVDGGRREIDPGLRHAVEAAWRRAVDGWVRAARRAPPDIGLGASPVEDLAAWFASPGADMPPAGLQCLLGVTVPRAAAVAERAEMVVLGHPVPPTDATSVMCLGRPAPRRWEPTAIVRADGSADAVCVAAGQVAPGPPTVVAHRWAGATVWRCMTGTDLASEVRPTPAVIVDAA